MKTHKEYTGYIGACCSPNSSAGVQIRFVDKEGEISYSNKITHIVQLTDKEYIKLSNELGSDKYTAKMKIINNTEIKKA